jgi:hypothetical protein
MELTFAQVPINIKPQKKQWRKIEWTPDMLQKLKERFPVEFNKDLAKELGISWRSLIRKARELSIEKEPQFLDKRRTTISRMAQESRPPNPTKGLKGWCVPNSEQFRFKPGHVPRMAFDPKLVERVHATRNETIRRDRIRAKIGLPRLTKFKFE